MIKFNLAIITEQGDKMSKHITEAEAQILWQKARAILVEHGFMEQSGVPTKNNEQLCNKMRHLFLVKATK